MPDIAIKIFIIGFLSVATIVEGAEFELHPSLAVSEEYTDNLFETPTNRISDYITRVMPGLAARYSAPALTGDLSYVFDYRHYARKNREDEVTHSLSAKGHLTGVENFMYLDVSDEFKRVSLDATRDVTKESLFVNQSDRNVVTASPYFTLRPTERVAVKSGYRFIDTRYFGSSGIDKTDHIAFLNMTYELSRRWSLTADYTFSRELAAIYNFSQHRALGGLRYEYGENSFVFAQAGNAWITYDSGQSLNSFNWNAGITQAFDTVAATLTTGVKYDEDPLSSMVKESFVSGSLEKRLKRGSLNLTSTYSEYLPTVYLPTTTAVQQTTKYGATVRGQYELSENLNGNLAFTAEKYEKPQFSSYTRRYQVDSAFTYLLSKLLTASLTYIYTDCYSPSTLNEADNWHGNRAIFEIKKTF